MRNRSAIVMGYGNGRVLLPQSAVSGQALDRFLQGLAGQSEVMSSFDLLASVPCRRHRSRDGRDGGPRQRALCGARCGPAWPCRACSCRSRTTGDCWSMAAWCRTCQSMWGAPCAATGSSPSIWHPAEPQGQAYLGHRDRAAGDQSGARAECQSTTRAARRARRAGSGGTRRHHLDGFRPGSRHDSDGRARGAGRQPLSPRSRSINRRSGAGRRSVWPVAAPCADHRQRNGQRAAICAVGVDQRGPVGPHRQAAGHGGAGRGDRRTLQSRRSRAAALQPGEGRQSRRPADRGCRQDLGPNFLRFGGGLFADFRRKGGRTLCRILRRWLNDWGGRLNVDCRSAPPTGSVASSTSRSAWALRGLSRQRRKCRIGRCRSTGGKEALRLQGARVRGRHRSGL